MEKKEIRRKIKNLRLMLSEAEKLAAAESVFARLEQEPAFLLAEHILMYHSLPDELPTHAFLRKWSQRKKFYLPRVNGVNLDILPYAEESLERGAYDIEEPQGADVVPPESLEMIVVPAVAYDRYGNRLGRGKGFYDRLLATTRAVTVGVAYDFQLLDTLIPTEQHDVPVDIVITQSNHVQLNKQHVRDRHKNNKR